MIVNSIKSLAVSFSLVLIAVALSGCGGKGRITDGPPPKPEKIDLSRVPDAVPKNEPKSRYGNPDSYVVLGKKYYTLDSSQGFVDQGIASWYGKKFHGRRTSSGEPYDMYQMTAAHKTLPLPTYAEVINLNNGRKITVKINDRGPFHQNRIIDLSYVAAMKLGIATAGTGLVEVRAIDPRHPQAHRVRQVPPAEKPIKTSKVLPPQMYLQAGAFGEKSNAMRLRDRLQQLLKGPVIIHTDEVNGQQIHRVRVGPIQDTATADRLVNVMDQNGHHDHRVVFQ